MMLGKRRRLTQLHAVQSEPSSPQTDTSRDQAVPPHGNSSTKSNKFFSAEMTIPSKLGSDFFNQSCISLARSFLGQILVRKLPDGRELRGRIVETEAYLGGEDKASHSSGGRQTPRNAAMFMKPGTLYVEELVLMEFLLRSLEPLQGLDTMRQLRSTQRKGTAKPLKDWELCNGPSKLCHALDINKTFDQRDLVCDPKVLVCTARIGIRGEWAHKPLRFYIRGNKCVSVVDKKMERETDSLLAKSCS
uniref:DNA-3-methyladenine glycosylase II n=1 Tax=Sphenodon punctatus TaxID=8508 RepID=A0A8D0HJU5_SPHPU